ncbi:MAG: hypothetical protein ACQESD_06170 [Thermoplasmatota archaeon]
MAENELKKAYIKIIGTVLLAMSLVILSAGLIQAHQFPNYDGIPELPEEGEDEDRTDDLQDLPEKVAKDSHEDTKEDELDKPRDVYRV